MTDDSGVLICPGVVPVLVGPLQVLIPILWGLLLAALGGILALFKPSSLKNLIKLLWRQKLAVSILVVAIGGAIFGVRALVPTTRADSNAAEQGKDWTTARLNLHRTGAVADAPTPVRAKLKWNFRDGDEGFLSSPAVVGNRVYVASASRNSIRKSGQIYCFDADTGAVVWISAPANYRPTFSSPVVSGNYLVCGEGLHDTRDARVVCLDVRPDQNGKVLWTFATENHVECTPVVANGRVYFGAGDDGVYCLNLEPDAQGKAIVHWHLSTEKYPDAETSLAVHDGKVYVGLGNEGKALCVLDAITGKELRRLEMPYPVFGPPSIADGKLYIGMGEGDYVNPAPGEGGEVRCLNLASLKVEWGFQVPKTVLGAVAIKNDRLYFSCKDGYLYCLNRKDGKLVGKFNAHTPVFTSPCVTEDGVFFVSDGGLLFGLNRHTLEALWEFRLGFRGNQPIPPFLSSPVAARGHLYVGTYYEGFFCYGDVKDEKQITPLWSNPLGGPGRCGTGDPSPLPEDVIKHWSYPAAGGTSQKISATVPIACWGDDLFVPFAVGKKTGLACLPKKAAPGPAPQPRWVYHTGSDIVQAVVLQDRVLTADLHELYCLERGSGNLLWQKDIASTGNLTVTPRQILVQDRNEIRTRTPEEGSGSETILDGRLTALDLDGKVRWSTSHVGQLRHAPAASASMIIAAADYPPAIVALDSETGDILWRTMLKEPPLTSPVLARSVFFLGTKRGLEARSLIDGQPLTVWVCDGGPPSAELALRHKDIIYVNQAGELIVADGDSGKVKTRLKGAVAGFPPLISRSQVMVVMEMGLGLVNLDATEPQMELWLEKAVYGELAAPAVLRDSRVFLPTRAMGLVCIGREK